MKIVEKGLERIECPGKWFGKIVSEKARAAVEKLSTVAAQVKIELWSRLKSAAPKQGRTAMFIPRDKAKDGKLTREEFLVNQPDPDKAPARFLQFDADKDGALSREEFIHSGKDS